MAGETKSLRFAVLIDADNASPQIAAGLFEEIAELGEATVRRISRRPFKLLAQRLVGASRPPRHSRPLPASATTTGKNASDIALVIDAMDLLHSGRVDGFCLVSSDSDFTRLASRIREEGLEVYGFGEKKTPESFRQACKRFIYTENLMGGGAAAAPVEPIAPGTAASAGLPVPPADPAAATRREPVQNAVPGCSVERGQPARQRRRLGRALRTWPDAAQSRARLRPAQLWLPQSARPSAEDRGLRTEAVGDQALVRPHPGEEAAAAQAQGLNPC